MRENFTACECLPALAQVPRLKTQFRMPRSGPKAQLHKQAHTRALFEMKHPASAQLTHSFPLLRVRLPPGSDGPTLQSLRVHNNTNTVALLLRGCRQPDRQQQFVNPHPAGCYERVVLAQQYPTTAARRRVVLVQLYLATAARPPAA